jgi:hypothetical protein
MKLFFSLRRILPYVLGLLLLWTGILSYSTLSNSANKRQLSLIPDETNLVFKVNFKDFLKQSTYSMIFHSKDQKLLNAFQEFLKSQQKGTGKSNDFGINYFSDIVVFGKKFQKGEVYVMMINLINQKKFYENLPHFLSPNQSYAIKNDVGLIATYYGEDKINQTTLKSYLSNLKVKNNITEFEKKGDEFFLMNLSDYNINKKFHINKGYIYSSLSEKELSLKGEFQLDKKFARPCKWTLKEDEAQRPLKIETAFISRSLQDTIQSYFSKVGLSIPKVNQLTFNYYGLDIQETELGLVFTPKFDMILNFDQKIYTEKIFHDPERLLKFGFDLKGDNLKAGKLNYTIDLLDSSTLFLGSNRDFVIEKKNFILMKIGGDLGKITQISGGGFVKSIINVIPQYKAAKDFFNTIQEYKLSLAPRSNKLLFIRGKIKLQDRYYLYNEFLKFYLTINGNF